MRKIFGIRHHGPGSSKRLKQALEAYEPDIILIEGPEEATELIEFIRDPELVPPVALLVYAPQDFEQVAYYPFAEFSPEWQAMRYGVEAEIPVSFIDISLSKQWKSNPNDETNQAPPDLLGLIAAQAGYKEGESWWEDVVETKSEQADIFDELFDLIETIRNQPHFQEQIDLHTLRREAYMRLQIRAAEDAGFERIAIVCGAFHAPALNDDSSVREDKGMLKGMKKIKTQATWIPWTYQRLSWQSGYGAGIRSPQWYDLLFRCLPEERVEQWMIHAAHLSRQQGLDSSPAHIIEGVRLAYALTNLRGLANPGLEELTDAFQTVFSFGKSTSLQLIEQELIIGSRRGSIPPDMPALPLTQDIKRLQKTLRLPPQSKEKTIDLDLRKDFHLRKSQFLHQMTMLGINWGEVQIGKKKDGSFHEYWKLKWHPESDLQVIAAATWGNTLLKACSRKVHQTILEENSIVLLSQLLEQVFWADLKDLIELVCQRLIVQVTLDADIYHFLQSLPTMVRVARYGDVRQVSQPLVQNVLKAMVPRLIIGLPKACTGLNDEFGKEVFADLVQAHAAIQLTAEFEQHKSSFSQFFKNWLAMLEKLSVQPRIHPKIAGMAVRMMFDQEYRGLNSTQQSIQQMLSPGTPIHETSTWMEGFLYGSGILLLHNPTLWELLDNWISNLSDETFQIALPVIRRTFSNFPLPERKQMGRLAKEGGDRLKKQTDRTLNGHRINKILPLLSDLLKIDTRLLES